MSEQHVIVTEDVIARIRSAVRRTHSREDVVAAVIDALAEADIDLRRLPTLDEMKRVLVEAFRLAEEAAEPQPTH